MLQKNWKAILFVILVGLFGKDMAYVILDPALQMLNYAVMPS